ncbi:type VI secretion system Vgr family protein [Marinobacter sp. C2H3]|uniref:type VI secretion system Vgr family protein n=1 Tax=Marinobacter sp. C2H3 TaxID=3119003 RepID=UPI00300F76EC
MPQANGLQFTVRVGGLPPSSFSVVSFQVTEALSDVSEGRLWLASTEPSVAAGDVLEQPVELAIWQDGECQRRFSGVARAFTRGGTGHHRTRYELTFAPPLWRLGLMHNSRIFQGETPEAILHTLLSERGIPGVRFDLKRPPASREYCVQYRETDLAFLARLAAEEGWHYRYQPPGPEAGDHEATLVFADHHGDAPGLAPSAFLAGTTPARGWQGVTGFSFRERIGPAAVTLKDYTFRNPAYGLTQEHQAPVSHRADYQHFDYPGRFKADDSGRTYTRARLDAVRNDTAVATGESTRPDFVPGARVRLTDHPGEALNRLWLLTSVIHRGEQPQALQAEAGQGSTRYHNCFCALPGERTWRPARPAVRVTPGPEIARVTGPEGEDIHCDRFGRVRVRFPWCRAGTPDERSSAWLRVSQAWAGGQYGAMMLPRVGHEVIVSFLDGDPDQPIITGRTYHAAHMPPLDLPRQKTRTVLKTRTHGGDGEGFNELRFEDEAGQEQVYLHAQRDLNLLVRIDRKDVVGQDHQETVGGNRKSEVGGGQHATVGGERRASAGGDYGLAIDGALHLRAGSAWLNTAGTELHIRAGQKVVLEAGSDLRLRAGGSFLAIDASGVSMGGASIRLNAGGAPGQGQGVDLVAPLRPVSVSASGASAESPALAGAPGRAIAPADPLVVHRLQQARRARAAMVETCQRQADGQCPLADCPCEREARV